MEGFEEGGVEEEGRGGGEERDEGVLGEAEGEEEGGEGVSEVGEGGAEEGGVAGEEGGDEGGGETVLLEEGGEGNLFSVVGLGVSVEEKTRV